MKKLKVMTVVGTRPEIIRLSCVLKKLDASEAIDHVLVHTGQNYDYELNEVFFEDLGLRKPDHFLNAATGNPSSTIGNIITAVDAVLEEVKPDAFMVLGDTNSCLCALPAKRRKVPVFHMEAGNRCFDQRVPEEINRKIVDHISDINLTYSDIAREYLLREGCPPDRVIKTGSPIYEVLHSHLAAIKKSDVLSRLKLKEGGYFVISAHREENVSTDMFHNMVEALQMLAGTYELPVIVSTHPRTRNRIEKEGIKFSKHIQLLKPLGFIDYVHLQMNARAVLSDSGTISEESSILNFPAVNIREAHERPEAFEEASVIFTGMNVERIQQALQVLETQPRGAERLLRPVADYSMPNVSDKVLRIIISYTDYINRVVWQKPRNV
jgi:UDP-N-acetylglucosamine 2-epimerase (non-hydrolysing)